MGAASNETGAYWRVAVPQRRYFSDYGRPSRPAGSNIVPYLIIAVLAGAGLFYLHNGSTITLPTPGAPPPAAQTLTLSGTLRDANSGVPLSGVLIGVRDASVTGTGGPAQADNGAGGAISATGTITVAGITTGTAPAPAPAPVFTDTSSAAGTFFFPQLPAHPMLMISHEGYAPVEVPVEGRTSIEIPLVPNTIRGVITGSDGKPVGGALVTSGTAQTLAGADGSFVLNDIVPNAQGYDLMVKEAGYRLGRAHLTKTGTQNVTLETFNAKAIYVSADTIADGAKFAALLQLADRTEINAMIIDVKKDTDGFVLYDSKLPAVQALGAINPMIPNLEALLQTLHEHKIYAIARLPLFWDEKLATGHPEWAIRSKANGGLWADAYDHHWTNPRRPEVWAYNLAIAKEVAQRGFDEIQFDYVRFPSDGNLGDADYGPTDNRTRSQVIHDFLQEAQTELSATGAFIAADVFGLTPIVKDDLGIGQHFEDIVDQVDFICPMAYPSHYADNFLNFPHPADHPSEVVGYTLEAAAGRLVGRHAKLRPWLQDFTLQGIVYDAAKVRAEIDASDNHGTLGWMLWNYDNIYTEAALKPQQ
jgi:hypothetical protein